MSFIQQQHLQQFDNALKDARTNKDYYKNLVADKLAKAQTLARAATAEGEEKKQAIAEAVGNTAMEVGAFSNAIDRARDFNTTIRNGTLLRRNVQQTTDQIQKGFQGLKNQLAENTQIANNPVNGAREELENVGRDAANNPVQAPAANQADANAPARAGPAPPQGEGGRPAPAPEPEGSEAQNPIYSRGDLEDARDNFNNLNGRLGELNQEALSNQYTMDKYNGVPSNQRPIEYDFAEDARNRAITAANQLQPQVDEAGERGQEIENHTNQNGFTDDARPAQPNNAPNPDTGNPRGEDPDAQPAPQNPNQGNLPARNAPTVENENPQPNVPNAPEEDGMARDLSLAAGSEEELGSSLSFAPELGLGVDILSGLTALGSELYQVFHKPKAPAPVQADPVEIKAPLGGAVGGNFSNTTSGQGGGGLGVA